jgi:hypothetical protein
MFTNCTILYFYLHTNTSNITPIYILIILFSFILFYSICISLSGIGSREVEYQVGYPSEISENLRKLPKNLRKTPKMAGNYENANVFTRLTNQKNIPVCGQFGLAASDYYTEINVGGFNSVYCG